MPRLARVPWFALAAALGCASDLPSFEDVPEADVLYERGLETLKGRRILGLFRMVDYPAAIESFQAIIDNYPYSDYAVSSELHIADAFFEDGKYDEALSYYRDFADLHPQNEKIPYTLYRSALCHYRQIRSANRDQAPTRESLAILERLMAKYPLSKEAQDAEVLWRELRLQLADAQMQIANFYMDRGEYQSAAQRYRNVLDDYPGLGLDPEALYHLGHCYMQMKRADDARRMFRAILENYAESEFAAAAGNWAVAVD